MNNSIIKILYFLLDKHPVEIVGVCPKGTLGLTRKIAMLFAIDCELNCGWMNILITLNSIGAIGSVVGARFQSPNRIFKLVGFRLWNEVANKF